MPAWVFLVNSISISVLKFIPFFTLFVEQWLRRKYEGMDLDSSQIWTHSIKSMLACFTQILWLLIWENAIWSVNPPYTSLLMTMLFHINSYADRRKLSIQPMKLSRPEYWSGWPFPSPGDPPNPGIKPRSPALQADSLPAEP